MFIRFKVILAFAAFAFAVFSGAAGAKGDTFAYVVNHSGEFGTLDLNTGAVATVGSSGVPYEDLAMSPGGVLYGINNAGDLYTVNPNTGSATLVDSTQSPNWVIKFAPDGTLFGLSFPSAALYSENLATGVPTEIGNCGIPSSSWLDLAFVGPNNLLMESAPTASSSSLYSVNTTTGNATLIGPIGYTVGSLLYDNGTLYGFTVGSGGSYPILSINTSTGAGTVVAYSDPSFGNVYGAAETSYAVPEPATFALLSTALLGLGIVYLRRGARRG